MGNSASLLAKMLGATSSPAFRMVSAIYSIHNWRLMKQLDIKSFLIFMVILFGIIQLKNYYQDKEKSQPSEPKQQDVVVVSNSQDAEGLTAQQFNEQFLAYFEKTTIEGVKQKIIDNYVSRGQPEPKLNIQAYSSLAQKGDEKLAILKASMTSDDRNFVSGKLVAIAGLKDGKFNRVSCMRDGDVEIPITYGVCADKIKEIFGWEIGR